MPIHTIQMDIIPGKPEKNVKNIGRLIEQGGNQDSHGFFVFPEMAIPGYFIGDRWRDRTLMQECHEMTDEIVAMTRGGIGVIFGNVTVDQDKKGENGSFRVYNSAIVAHDGKLIENEASQYLGAGRTHKSLMPNYGMFHDKRHFTSLRQLADELDVTFPDILRAFELPIDGEKEKIGVIICEDMWDADYVVKPTNILRDQGVTHMVNISSSPFGISKAPVRDAYLKRQSAGFKQFWYANNIGRGGNGKNEHVFDGASLLFENGDKKMQAPTFQEGIFDAENGVSEAPTKGKEIYDALVYSIRERWESIGKPKVIIGLSGGIDSAISAALHVHAVGPENVVGVNMPTEFNGAVLKDAARDLAQKLGIQYHVIPLGERITLLKNQVEDILGMQGGLDGLPFENIQARDRSTSILAAVAGAYKGVYTCNGNKSELFTGYCTLDGDARGFMAPIADLYKTQIRSLTHYMNQEFGEIVPKATLEVAASAELSADQTIEKKREGESPFRGTGGDPFVYPYHDALFYQVWDMETSPADILKMYQDGALREKLHKNYDTLVDTTVVPQAEIDYAHQQIDTLMSMDPALFVEDFERIYRLLRYNFFKRVQAPTIIALSRRSFGYDTHEAENGVEFGRTYDHIKAHILGQNIPLGGPVIQKIIREQGTLTPKKQPVLARLPRQDEIGTELVTYVADVNGRLIIESRHFITPDMVLCRNEGVLGQIDGVDIYNEWPRESVYWDKHYGATLTHVFQSCHKKTVATLIPVDVLWAEIGGQEHQDTVEVSVPWGSGSMTVFRDGYASSDGNGISLTDYQRTYL